MSSSPDETETAEASELVCWAAARLTLASSFSSFYLSLSHKKNVGL